MQSQAASAVICLTTLMWASQFLSAEDTLELNPHTPDLSIHSIEPRRNNGLSSLSTPFGLTRRDLDVFQEIFKTVPAICPTRRIRAEVRVDHHTLNSHLVGTSPAAKVIHDLQLSRGRFLTGEDVQWRRNVAVMGEQQARQLFQNADPIGQSIRVGHNYYLIVGLVSQPLKQIRDRHSDIYIPITTMWSRLGNVDMQTQSGSIIMKTFELSSIEFQLSDDTDRQAMVRAIRKVLEQLHDDQDFAIHVPNREVAP